MNSSNPIWVSIEALRHGATSWVHFDVGEFHDYINDIFFIKEHSNYYLQTIH